MSTLVVTGTITGSTGSFPGGPGGAGVLLSGDDLFNSGLLLGGYGGVGQYATSIGGPGGPGGAGGAGVVLSAAGSVGNSGTIAGGTGGLGGFSGNLAPIGISGRGGIGGTGGSGGAGVLLSAAGSLVNYRMIAGGAGGNAYYGGSGGSGGAGIVVSAGGSISNSGNSSAIFGGDGGSGYTGLGGDGGAGVVLSAGGSISNSGHIYGGIGGTGGSGGAGVLLSAGGSLVNYRMIAGGAGGNAYYGGSGGSGGAGIVVSAGGSISNSGRIAGGFGGYNGITGVGVMLTGGGSLTNNSGIIGSIGVQATGAAAATVTNYGTITGSGGTAVSFGAAADRLIVEGHSQIVGIAVGGGTLELAGGAGAGTLSSLGTRYIGFANVVEDTGASWTLTGDNTIANGTALTAAGTLIDAGSLLNSGSIINNTVTLAAGGYLDNLAGGVIQSGGAAVRAQGGAAFIKNAGTIAGTVGLDVGGTDNTIVNSGTVSGSSGTAVAFGSGNDQLVLDPGAVFIGTVDGGGGNNTLELAVGPGVGTLAGVGGQFVNFETIAVDAGASWTLTGGNTLATGASLIDAGRLINSGSIADTVTLAAGGYLDNLAGGVVIQSSGIAVFGQDGPTSVSNAGTIFGDYGVALNAGGSVINRAGGRIEAYGNLITGSGLDAVLIQGEPGMVVNAGIIGGWAYGVSLVSGAVTNAAGGFILSVGPGDGVRLGHGTVTNQTSGAIFGGLGVQLGSGTLINQGGGYIGGDGMGAGAAGVQILSVGTVENSGEIKGNNDGVFFFGSGIVVNQSGGVIVGTNTDGVFLGTGTVINQSGGVIAGERTGIVIRGGGTVENGGAIRAGIAIYRSGSTAIYLGGAGGNRLVLDPGYSINGNVVTTGSGNTLELAAGNGSTGTLSRFGSKFGNFANLVEDTGASWKLTGGNTIATGTMLTAAGALIDAGSLFNSGSIAGAVTLAASGYLDNSATGTITAGGIAVYGQGSADIVKNAGTIAGGIFGVASIGPQTDVSNYGTIGGSGSGVVLDDGGEIRNGAYDANRASIRGGYNGVLFVGGQGTLANYGTISGGTGAGVRTLVGVSVTNAAGGAIVGGMVFSARSDDDGTLLNAGTITAATAAGVELYRGGVVTNGGSSATNALIAGGTVGVRLTSYLIGGYYYTYSPTTSATRITNFGTISGQTGVQVDATVSAYRPFPNNNFRYDFPGNIANNTLVNGGTVIGSGGTAVAFGSGNDLLVVDPGALFVGIVDGGGGNNTIELAVGPSVGTLAGVGSQFVDFTTIAVDAGADWTLTGNNTIASGVSLANSGTLDITGTLDIAGAVMGTQGTALGFGTGTNLLVLETSGMVSGAIDGFLPGDTVDLRGVAAAGLPTLGAGNLLTIPESGGSATLQLDPNQNYSQYVFRATSDGLGGSDITVIPDPGPTAGNGSATVGHGKTVDLTSLVEGLVTPGLPGDTDTPITAVALSGVASVANGMLSYTAPASSTDTLTYTVANQFGETASGMVTVTVDPGPSAGTGATTLGHGKTADLTGLVNGLITPGLAGDSETLTSVSAAHGTATLVNGVISYTAPAFEPDTLTYTVTDQYGDTASGAVNVTIDRGPVAGTGATTVGHGKSADLTGLVNGLITPGLVGDSETLISVSAANGMATLVNGVVSYTAPASGTDTLTYTVADQLGDSATGAVNVAVDPGPQVQVAAPTNLGHNQTIDLTSTIRALVFPGLSGDVETVTAVSGTNGTANLANGVITFTAAFVLPGAALVGGGLSYTVADQHGDTATGGVPINVDGGPGTVPGSITVGQGKTVDLTGLVHTLFHPALAGEVDTVTTVSAAHGTASLVNGIVTYTAPASGPDTLTFTVADQYGDATQGTVAVTVDPGPSAGTGATTIGHNKTANLTSTIQGLVVPGIAGDTEKVVAVQAAHGIASVDGNGIVSYTAPSTGPDSLTYTVADQYGDSASGALNIMVDPGPTAGAATITVATGAATDLTSYLLSLDTPGLSGDMLTLTGDNTTGTKGAISLVNGDLTYTAPTIAGSDSFGYTVSDQYGDSASATLTVSAVSLSHIGNGSGTIVLGDSSGTTRFGQGSVTVIAGDGNNSISGGNAGDTITVGNGNDTVSLGNGANTVTLGTGNDSVTVGNANNTITINGAASSTDTIMAGNGNNTLTLGAGNYTVTVGTGQNTFIFQDGGTYNITAGGGGPDLFIFTAPQGLLNLSFGTNDELVFRNTGFDLGGGTSTPQPIAASLFSPNTDGTFAAIGNRFAYNRSTGALYYDAQGSAAGSTSTEIALLTNKPNLAASNLFFTS